MRIYRQMDRREQDEERRSAKRFYFNILRGCSNISDTNFVSRVTPLYPVLRILWTAPTKNGGTADLIFNIDNLILIIPNQQGGLSANVRTLWLLSATSEWAILEATNLPSRVPARASDQRKLSMNHYCSKIFRMNHYCSNHRVIRALVVETCREGINQILCQNCHYCQKRSGNLKKHIWIWMILILKNGERFFK